MFTQRWERILQLHTLFSKWIQEQKLIISTNPLAYPHSCKYTQAHAGMDYFLFTLSESSDLVPPLLLYLQQLLLPELCRAVLRKQKLSILNAQRVCEPPFMNPASQAESRPHHTQWTLQMSAPLGTAFQRTAIIVMLLTSATLLVTDNKAFDQHWVPTTGLE